MIKTCKQCGETNDYEDGHSIWKCKQCGGFILDKPEEYITEFDN